MMTLDALLRDHRHHVLFSCVAGSRAYGTSTPDSDEDLRGVYAVPARSYLALETPVPQLADERGNIVYFSLRRLVELLSVANPNVLELLFMPVDCVRESAPEMQRLIAARRVFITRQCGETHIGYALSQVRKARGRNKWVNDPKPAEAPAKEDFCYLIDRDRLQQSQGRFAGLLLFNEQSWKQSLADHHNYWKWRRDRNESRWRQQESGELDFDSKNMMHTVRLLLSGRSILRNGEPVIRFSGPDLELLLDIRAGKLSFERIMAIANDVIAECETLQDKTDLPATCDMRQANALLEDLTAQWEARASA
jgi:uncharacterized protein